MFNIKIKYSTNNIFLSVLHNKKKIYSKSTGQFLKYNKGKQKISNLAFLFIFNDFCNCIFINFIELKFEIVKVEIFGCTYKRFIFFKKNLLEFLSKIQFKYLFFLDKSLISFNGCRLKKKKKKTKKIKFFKKKFKKIL
jgi:hypothetical protein